MNLGKMVSFIAFLLVNADRGSASTVYRSWEGCYENFDYSGRTVGGTPITQTYTLRVNYPDSCDIKREGFQIDDHLVCELSGSDRSVHVRFLSYPGGSTENDYGFSPFVVGEDLFVLDRPSVAEPTITSWVNLSPEGATSTSGTYFQRCRHEAI